MRLTILSFILLITAAQVYAQTRRVVLVSEAVVAGERICLSDLLPPQAGLGLRTAAADINLGRSPQPGSFRVFTREQLRTKIGGSLQVHVPEQVVIRRPWGEGPSARHMPVFQHSAPAFLVRPRNPASLVIEEDSIRIQLRVLPLRRAALGEPVQAIDPITHRVFAARVSGENLLRLRESRKDSQ